MKRNAQLEDEVTLADVWRAIAEGKWIIISATAFVAAAAAIAAYTMTPIYRAEVLLAPRDDAGGSGGVGGLSGLASLAGVRLESGGGQKARAIAILTSRAFAEDFIRKHDLMPVLFAGIWNPETKTWQVENPKERPTMRRAVRAFQQIRSIREDPDTGLVTLAMEFKDPQLSAQWAMEFVQDLNAEMRQQAITEAQKSIHYLEEEADKTSVLEVERSIYGLIEDQIESVMLANVREQYAFEILDPAVVPEPDQKVRPNRSLMVVAGLILGMLSGLFIVFARSVVKSVSGVVHERDGH